MPRETPQVIAIRVEHGLYAVLFVLALILRVYRLGTLHLFTPQEAAQAWPAWASNNAVQLPLVEPVSPLLFTLQRFLFFLTDGNEFWARLAPALAGAGLVLAAWSLRRCMGRGGALAAALGFAFDPWLLAFSRLGDSAILSVLLGVLLLAWLCNTRDQETTQATDHRLQTTAVAVIGGLFLISGPLAWLLLPLILFAIFLLDGRPISRLSPLERGRAAVVFAATVLIGSSGLLTHISGLATIAESLGVAIAHLTAGSEAAVYPLQWGLLRLLVDEPFLVLFGGSGLVVVLKQQWAVKASHTETLAASETLRATAIWQRILAAGVGWGLLCLLLPGRTPLSLLVLGLPLLLLAAGTAATLLRFGLSRLNQLEASWAACATMGILLVTAFFWTGNAVTALRPGNFEPGLLAFYLLLPALCVFFVWWFGLRTSGQMLGLLLLTVFFLANISSSWMLNLRPDIQRRSLFVETAADGLTLLVQDVARLSSLRAGDPTEAVLYLLVRPQVQPFYAWHLRTMRHIRWGPDSDPMALDASALVVRDAGASLHVADDFIGSSYSVIQRWLPTDLAGLSQHLLWALYGERPHKPLFQEVELWVKQ